MKKPSAVVKSVAKGAKVTVPKDDVIIASSTVKIGGGKDQTYLQHMPVKEGPWRLIVAVTAKSCEGIGKTHKEIIQQLEPMCKRPGMTKSKVVAERNRLIS